MKVKADIGVATAAAAAGDFVPQVIAVAASAGGVHALSYVLSNLPASFPAAVIVLLHLSPGHHSLFPAILARRCALPVKQAEDGDRLLGGHAYVAPAGRHVSVNGDGTLSLLDTARVHFVRPSADVLFESLASAARGRAVVVVLSGAGSDGARGARAVKRAGGTVVAQDRGSSEYFGMPGAAITACNVDHVLPLEQIPAMLTRLAAREAA